MKNPSFIVTAVLLCGLSGPALAAVTASLDQDHVANGESVQLVLQHDGSGGGEPDLSPLKKDFDILGTSSGSNIQIVNGHMSSQRELQLTLSPKHTGTLQIPPLTWDGEKSQALSLAVEGAVADNQAGHATAGAQSPHIFLTTSLDQKQPYVQSAVVLTVQLHTDQQLYQASLTLSGNNDVQVQQLGKDQQLGETRDGHQYSVIERKYLLLPQRSGVLSLDGPALDAQIADTSNQDPFARVFGGSLFAGTFNTTRPIRLHGDPIQLNVRPRPAALTGPDWLPAKQVTLEEAWHPDSASVHVGDPLTLHVRLRALGLTAAQLPDLSTQLSLPEGLKAYPDQAKLDTSLQSDDVVGSRDQDIALIASRPGHYQFPALRLTWWDTKQDAQREAVLPGQTLDILPAAGDAIGSAPISSPQVVANASSAPVPAAAAAKQPRMFPGPASIPARSPLLWISLILGLLWIGTLTAWWRVRGSTSQVKKESRARTVVNPILDEGGSRKAFQEACRDNDAYLARRKLLDWARAASPENPPSGLNALAERLDNTRITELLLALDRACYADGDWEGAELAATLTSPRSAIKTGRAAPKLADLYP